MATSKNNPSERQREGAKFMLALCNHTVNVDLLSKSLPEWSETRLEYEIKKYRRMGIKVRSGLPS